LKIKELAKETRKRTLSDITNKKDKLGLIYKGVKENLEKRTDWQAYQGEHWRLRFVDIMSTGER
jgi:hypothetical protein